MSELGRLADDLLRASEGILDRVEVATRKSTLDVEHTAQAIVAVDTGFLRSSIGSDVQRQQDTITGEVGPTAEYGPHVEYGTSRMAPQAYMGPALDRHAGDYEQAILQIGEQLQ